MFFPVSAYGTKADMLNALTNVCFRGQSGHGPTAATNLDLWVHGLADTLAMFILFNRITVRDRVDVGRNPCPPSWGLMNTARRSRRGRIIE